MRQARPFERRHTDGLPRGPADARVLALDYETANAAIDYALQKGWLIGEGAPTQSICLTDEGRALQIVSKHTRN